MNTLLEKTAVYVWYDGPLLYRARIREKEYLIMAVSDENLSLMVEWNQDMESRDLYEIFTKANLYWVLQERSLRISIIEYTDIPPSWLPSYDAGVLGNPQYSFPE